MSQDTFQLKGHIADALNKEMFDGRIVVENGRISRIFKEEVPADAPFILPGFVDSHIHVESTLLTPEHYAALAVKKGTVAIVSDPHEIANVTGLEGVDFMIENGRRVHFHFNFGASPCVPCTPFETAGAILDSKAIGEMLQRDEIYGLAEFMNAVGVVTGDEECRKKIAAAKSTGKPIDGHAPGISGDMLETYVGAGISTDHECVSLDEARERLALGMKIQIREGSAALDFDTLSPLLAESGDMLMFCSDDKYPDELAEGYIDDMVKRSLKAGYPLWNVLSAACVTPVRHYGLKHGLLQEGDSADFITVDNLDDFNVTSTFIDGLPVYADGQVNYGLFIKDSRKTDYYPNKFKAEKITASDLDVKQTGKKIKVMKACDKSLRTEVFLADPVTRDGSILPDIASDILKLVVYNRYSESSPQVAFINGFGFKSGAMASSIAHDSHNIIAVGTSDEDIAAAINEVIDCRGGIAITDGKDIKSLALPVAGLMSAEDGDTVTGKYLVLKRQAALQGCPFSAPFMTLAFMALPVIPDLKLTDKGLFDACSFSFTDLQE